MLWLAIAGHPTMKELKIMCSGMKKKDPPVAPGFTIRI